MAREAGFGITCGYLSIRNAPTQHPNRVLGGGRSVHSTGADVRAGGFSCVP